VETRTAPRERGRTLRFCTSTDDGDGDGDNGRDDDECGTRGGRRRIGGWTLETPCGGTASVTTPTTTTSPVSGALPVPAVAVTVYGITSPLCAAACPYCSEHNAFQSPRSRADGRDASHRTSDDGDRHRGQ
jgi:hypothetical protein